MTRVAPTIVLAALLCAPQGFAGGERGEDLEALLVGAEEVQRRDLASWREFRFQREVVRRSLDDDSREKKREFLLFLIRPRLTARDSTSTWCCSTGNGRRSG